MRGRCEHCGVLVAMAAKARIRGGRVVLACQACDTKGEGAAFAPEPVTAVEPALPLPPRRAWVAGVPVAAAAVGAILLLATGGFATGQRQPAAAIGASAFGDAPPAGATDDEPGDLEYRLGDEGGAEDDDESDDDSALVPFDVDGVVERYPSLRDWVHPVERAPIVVPRKSSRKFGAARAGDRPLECGRGHCGVDLGGEVGTPIYAVAWGEVVRIERRPDRRSGRYVKLRHPEGEETAYMHLDEIAEGLHVGDEVEAGHRLGTLGRSGIHAAMPHLHFGLSIPADGAENPEAMVYIDPVPFLREAAITAR